MVACGEGVDSGNVPGQRPCMWGMFKYKEVASTVAMMVSGGRG